MKEQFLQKISSYIQENRLIREGDLIFAGVSGGADSICLLEVLRAYQQKVDFALRVIHVEHGIRGADSFADAAYVQRFCEQRGIVCETVSVDAVGYARQQGISLEEAARMLRYKAFETIAERSVADPQVHSQVDVRIAVAHHREDQAETVLWQLIRGSDLRGLGGMRPRRERTIRPLLCVGRAEIEAFLQEERIDWREDATNADRLYTRNRLRIDVMPVLEQLNAQAVLHLCECATRVQQTEDYLAEQTAQIYASYVKEWPGGARLICKELMTEPEILRRRVLYQALTACCKAAKDLEAKHVVILTDLFSHQVGRRIRLPYGVSAARVYEGVVLSSGEGKVYLQDEILPDPKLVQMEVLEHFQMSEISKKKYTKWFDYDKIEHSVRIRKRQSGDYLMIDGNGHRQKLKNYLINEKIPQTEREHLLLMADGSHIMWIIGHRISDYYKIGEDTKRVLKVQYNGGKENE